ncbi:MAG: leucine-rich repeat protein [Coriobacteriaceae bacterium]|nr:leucine-rich repeat protein [Coriobacteriaceae bacterium]
MDSNEVHVRHDSDSRRFPTPSIKTLCEVLLCGVLVLSLVTVGLYTIPVQDASETGQTASGALRADRSSVVSADEGSSPAEATADPSASDTTQPTTAADADAAADVVGTDTGDAASAASQPSDLGALAAVDADATDVVERYFSIRAQEVVGADGAETSASELDSSVLASSEERSTGFALMAANANIDVTDAEVSLRVDDVSEADGVITLALYEWTTFTYDDLSDEVVGNDSAAFGTEHELTLAFDEATQAWLIRSDAYDEYDLCGVDTTEEASPSSAAAAVSTLSVTDASSTISTYASKKYNASAAVKYADRYALSYNKSYRNFNSVGGDCANFVSQCLDAGGLNQVVGSEYASPKVWYYKSGSNCSSSWIYCPTQVNFMSLVGTYVSNPGKKKITAGNPVYYKNGGVWAHATICVGTNSAGTPIIDAHNSDRYHVPYTYWDTTRCTVQMSSTTLIMTDMDGNEVSADASALFSEADANSEPRFTWSVISSTKVSLVNYSGVASDITVPKKVKTSTNTYKVRAIASYAFADNTTLRSITLPSTLHKIYSYAFYHCANLQRVKGGTGTTRIDASAFQHCGSLVSVPTFSALTGIGTAVFAGCSSLQKIKVTSTALTSVGKKAFYNCSSLTKAVFKSDRLSSLGECAFKGCRKLTVSPKLSAVTSIGRGTFAGCSSMQKLRLKSKALTSIGQRAFYQCSSLKLVTISSKKLTAISARAFSKCKNLKRMSLQSKKLSSVGKKAFAGCKNLRVLKIHSKHLRRANISRKAFKGIHAPAKIRVRSGKVRTYRKLMRSRGLSRKVGVKKL